MDLRLEHCDPRALDMCYVEGGEGGAGGGAGNGGGGGAGSGTPVVYDQAYVDRLKNEAAALRVSKDEIASKLTTYEQQERERQEAEAKAKGDFEKLAKDREREIAKLQTKYETELRNRDLKIIHSELDKLTKTMGMSPEAFAKLDKFIDIDKIKLDEAGNLVGHMDQLEALKAEMPFMFKPATATGGDGRAGGIGPGRGTGTGAATDFRDRTAVPDAVAKVAWANLGKAV